MERKVGEVFTYNGKTYRVEEVEIDEECKGCAFEFSSCCTSSLGDCSPTHRTDGASVIFKEINNMEIKNNQLTIDIPEGYEIQIRPRSGLAAKNGVTVLNTPGTIDSDYRGEIKIILVNLSDKDFVVNNGERIAQMVIAPVTQASFTIVDQLSDTERGTGGFGSTGK